MAEAAPSSKDSSVGPTGEDLRVSMPESWHAPANRSYGPAERVAVIEDSLRCLTYGWLSLVPVAGAFFVIPAVRLFQRVDRERAEWNPAQHLWLRGLVLACFGFWSSLLWWWLLFWWGGMAVMVVDANETAMAMILVYLLLFGSAPTIYGLGCAAARWPNRFGTFVQRRRVGLLWLMGGAYAVLILLLVLYEVVNGAPRRGVHISQNLSIHSQLAIWLVWVLGGFIGLAWRCAKRGWWIAWLTGAVLLTLWLTVP